MANPGRLPPQRLDRIRLRTVSIRRDQSPDNRMKTTHLEEGDITQVSSANLAHSYKRLISRKRFLRVSVTKCT